MAKSKIYAVKKGFKTGLFYSWSECQEATKGYSGPVFKSFESEEEARAFLDDIDIVMNDDILPRLKMGHVVAFTDGSFDVEKKAYGSGCCIFAPEGKKVELSTKGTNKKYIDLRNIAGEIIAVLNAIDWAWKNGYEKISVFYDYEGIGKWASGEWKPKKTLTSYYKKYIDEKREIIDIEYIKVSGHSNNKYNDRADQLAKSAIFENKIIRDYNSNSGYIITPVNVTDINVLIEKLKSQYEDLEYNVSENGFRKIWTITLQQDKVNISIFNDIKLVVQGNRTNLFQILTTEIIDSIACNDFIQILKSAYNISIDAEKTDEDFNKYLPTLSKQSIPENISLLLKQSIINLNNPAKYDVEFSMYAFPVLRALEGLLKYNLYKCKIHMTSNRFDMFQNVNGVYLLKDEYRGSNTTANIMKLENCYNHLYNNRHTLVHFGIILWGKDVNTRLINSKSEVNELITDTLTVIDQNYI